MKNIYRYTAGKAIFTCAAVLAFASLSFGQTSTAAKDTTANAAPSGNTQTVNAQQSGAWTVGLDPAKNTVQLSNSQSDPLAVKVIGSGSARKPFQTRILLTPTSDGFTTGFVPIPAGKRLVIENVSAIARSPEGLRMEINYFTYYDNDGDGVGGIADITFHRFALTDQGTFQGTTIASANHKVLVFADELIGTAHFQIGVQARLTGTTTSFAQGQVTLSGYLEDLPTAP